MAFDLKKFRKEKFSARTEEVLLPELKNYFADEKPVFKVRGMTGDEMYRVREAAEKRRDMQTIISKLTSGQGDQIAEALKELYGDDTVPDEFVKRVEIVLIGCVEPSLERQDVMKLFRNYPTQAGTLATKILFLTGEGSLPGEPKDSGKTTGSDTTAT
jgi:hypothetical protein